MDSFPEANLTQIYPMNSGECRRCSGLLQKKTLCAKTRISFKRFNYFDSNCSNKIEIAFGSTNFKRKTKCRAYSEMLHLFEICI